MGNPPFLLPTAQVAKPGIAAVSKTAGRKAAQVQILPWALFWGAECHFLFQISTFPNLNLSEPR